MSDAHTHDDMAKIEKLQEERNKLAKRVFYRDEVWRWLAATLFSILGFLGYSMYSDWSEKIALNTEARGEFTLALRELTTVLDEKDRRLVNLENWRRDAESDTALLQAARQQQLEIDRAQSALLTRLRAELDGVKDDVRVLEREMVPSDHSHAP